MFLFDLAFVFFLLAYYAKTTLPIFTKFGGKEALGAQKKRLGFASNAGHITLGLWLWLGGDETCSVSL